MAADTTGFRFDINGLRAWAVISVILFHFAVPGFSGGFVGVDVFFCNFWLFNDRNHHNRFTSKYLHLAGFLSRPGQANHACVGAVVSLAQFTGLVIFADIRF